jgi:hypothetical protein
MTFGQSARTDSGLASGTASGTFPGQIGTCTWPGEGCQTAASAREWAHASTNKKITRIGSCMFSMEVAGFDLFIFKCAAVTEYCC